MRDSPYISSYQKLLFSPLILSLSLSLSLSLENFPLYTTHTSITCEQSQSRQSTLHTVATPLPTNSDNTPKSPQPQLPSPPPLLPLLITTVIASLQPVCHPPLAACIIIVCVLCQEVAIKVALHPVLQEPIGIYVHLMLN